MSQNPLSDEVREHRSLLPAPLTYILWVARAGHIRKPTRPGYGTLPESPPGDVIHHDSITPERAML